MLCLKQPQLLNCVVLIYPMLDVGKETYQQTLVLWVFKNTLCMLLLTWPIMPNKDIISISMEILLLCHPWHCHNQAPHLPGPSMAVGELPAHKRCCMGRTTS